MNQKGFAPIILILIVILLGIEGYLTLQQKVLLPAPAPAPIASPTPNQIPLPTPTLISPQIDKKNVCSDLQQRINNELLKINYCSSDSDCSSESVLKYGEDGEFRCGDGVPNYYHNKNAGTKTLKQLGQKYATSQCPAAPDGGCRGPREDEISRVACVQSKCVLTFSSNPISIKSVQSLPLNNIAGCGVALSVTGGKFLPAICEFQIISPGPECGPNTACSSDYAISLKDNRLTGLAHILEVSFFNFIKFENGMYRFNQSSKEFKGQLLDENNVARTLLNAEVYLESVAGGNIKVSFDALFANNIIVKGSGIIPVKYYSAP